MRKTNVFRYRIQSRNMENIEKRQFEEGFEKREREEKPLDLDYASKLLFLSFRFSQGKSDELQREIFKFLKVVHPEWQMDLDFQKNLTQKTEGIVKKYSKAIAPARPNMI